MSIVNAFASRCVSSLIARSSPVSWLLMRLLACSSFQLRRHEQSGRSFHLAQEEVEVSVQGHGPERERTVFARWRLHVEWWKATPLFRSSCHSVAPGVHLGRRARREIGVTTECPGCPDYRVRHELSLDTQSLKLESKNFKLIVLLF